MRRAAHITATGDAPSPCSKTPKSVVCVIAYLGTGKTFTGDYLELHHGFVTVDGDEQLLNQHKAHNKRVSEGLMQTVVEYWLQDRSVPEEPWQPYLRVLCEKVAQQFEVAERRETGSAASGAELLLTAKVVLTFSLYWRQVKCATSCGPNLQDCWAT